MKKIILGFFVIVGVISSSQVFARDSRWFYSIDEALKTRAAKLKLDTNIKLYFGNQPHPQIDRSIGEWHVVRRAGGFARTDKNACQRTFIAALVEMQNKARLNGANAILDIKSYYKGTEHKNDTEFECGSGHLVSGVELKGRLVKVSP